MMAYDGMRGEIEFEKSITNKNDDKNQVTALVTFEKRGRVRARYNKIDNCFRLMRSSFWERYQKSKSLIMLYNIYYV
jgi:hypothetical protein